MDRPQYVGVTHTKVGCAFYNNNPLKGILFSMGAFALGELYYGPDAKKHIGGALGLLHIVSIVEAVWTAIPIDTGTQSTKEDHDAEKK